MAEQSSLPERAQMLRCTMTLQLEDLFDTSDFPSSIASAAAMIKEVSQLDGAPIEPIARLEPMVRHDTYAYNHGVNVSLYSMVLAKKIFGENAKKIWEIGFGGLIHDIGESEIDEETLHKAGNLSREELDAIQNHPKKGEHLLEEIPNIPKQTREIVALHHESLDGSGYPNGLTEKQIPECVLITSICDVYDTMTTARPFQPAHSPAIAIEMMRAIQPFRFSKPILDAFIEEIPIR